MSESLSDAVREAAQGEAERKVAAVREECGWASDDAAWYRHGFAQGAAWIAGRLPSGGDIARLVHPGYGRNGITKETCAACASTEELADMILALIREHVTRG